MPRDPALSCYWSEWKTPRAGWQNSSSYHSLSTAVMRGPDYCPSSVSTSRQDTKPALLSLQARRSLASIHRAATSASNSVLDLQWCLGGCVPVYRVAPMYVFMYLCIFAFFFFGFLFSLGLIWFDCYAFSYIIWVPCVCSFNALCELCF